MLTPHDAMRLLEEGGVSGLVRYNWSEALTKAIQAAYAAGAKDMQERCAKVCRDVEAENSVPPLIDLRLANVKDAFWHWRQHEQHNTIRSPTPSSCFT